MYFWPNILPNGITSQGYYANGITSQGYYTNGTAKVLHANGIVKSEFALSGFFVPKPALWGGTKTAPNPPGYFPWPVRHIFL